MVADHSKKKDRASKHVTVKMWSGDTLTSHDNSCDVNKWVMAGLRATFPKRVADAVEARSR